MKHIYSNSKLMFSAVFAILLLLTNCKTAEKALNSGNYDFVIEKSVTKLRRNKAKKDYARLLEEAFRRANNNDLATIKSLNQEGQPNRWAKITDLYHGINYRQNLIKPLLPLFIAEENRDAKFNFINASSHIIESKEKTAAYHYAEGNRLLSLDDRMKARQAYHEFLEVKKLYQNYKDIDSKIETSINNGQAHVLVEFVMHKNIFLPNGFMQEIKHIDAIDHDSFWTSYRLDKNTDQMDYLITVGIDQALIHPEKVLNNVYTDKKEIEDGWEYVLDGNGNVVKDTLGNDVKEPKIVTIRCKIRRVTQEKDGFVSGKVIFKDLRSNKTLRTEKFIGESFFNNTYATANGDLRALTDNSRNLLKNNPVPFPLDEDMILGTINPINIQIRQILNDNRNLIQ